METKIIIKGFIFFKKVDLTKNGNKELDRYWLMLVKGKADSGRLPGSFVNSELVKQGYAMVMTVPCSLRSLF